MRVSLKAPGRQPANRADNCEFGGFAARPEAVREAGEGELRLRAVGVVGR